MVRNRKQPKLKSTSNTLIYFPLHIETLSVATSNLPRGKNIYIFFEKLQFLLKTSVETNLVGNQFKSNLLINTKMNYLHKKTFPIYMFQNIPWGKLHENFAISRQKKQQNFVSLLENCILNIFRNNRNRSLFMELLGSKQQNLHFRNFLCMCKTIFSPQKNPKMNLHTNGVSKNICGEMYKFALLWKNILIYIERLCICKNNEQSCNCSIFSYISLMFHALFIHFWN